LLDAAACAASRSCLSFDGLIHRQRQHARRLPAAGWRC